VADAVPESDARPGNPSPPVAVDYREVHPCRPEPWERRTLYEARPCWSGRRGDRVRARLRAAARRSEHGRHEKHAREPETRDAAIVDTSAANALTIAF